MTPAYGTVQSPLPRVLQCQSSSSTGVKTQNSRINFAATSPPVPARPAPAKRTGSHKSRPENDCSASGRRLERPGMYCAWTATSLARPAMHRVGPPPASRRDHLALCGKNPRPHVPSHDRAEDRSYVDVGSPATEYVSQSPRRHRRHHQAKDRKRGLRFAEGRPRRNVS